MKVLFDHQAFKYRFGGVAKYHFELAKHLKKIGIRPEFSILFSQSEYFRRNFEFPVYNPLGEYKLRGRYWILGWYGKLNHKFALYKLKKGKFDIFHPSYYDTYFLPFLKKPLVVTVHDCIHELFSPIAYAKDIADKKELLQKADAIIAISHHTKSDIQKMYNISESKITVIYHGYTADEYKLTPNTYGDYLLFVGKRSGYKNFELFVKAISEILQNDTSLKLICTGSPFTADEIEILDLLQISDKVLLIPASENQLFNLYRHAKLFVFPSLYEGFGMPILEAFAAQCPICISNASCFPEIAGDAAIYFDPTSATSIKNAVDRLLNDTSLRKELILKGNSRLQDFSWEKAASQTAEVYTKLVNNEHT